MEGYRKGAAEERPASDRQSLIYHNQTNQRDLLQELMER